MVGVVVCVVCWCVCGVVAWSLFVMYLVCVEVLILCCVGFVLLV